MVVCCIIKALLNLLYCLLPTHIVFLAACIWGVYAMQPQPTKVQPTTCPITSHCMIRLGRKCAAAATAADFVLLLLLPCLQAAEGLSAGASGTKPGN
jgi:hypothetical protein